MTGVLGVEELDIKLILAYKIKGCSLRMVGKHLIKIGGVEEERGYRKKRG